MKKIKRLEKNLYFLEILTEEDLADRSSYFKRKTHNADFTTFKALRHDIVKTAFVTLSLKAGNMKHGPGLYFIRVRIPFPSRYYYTKVKRIV